MTEIDYKAKYEALQAEKDRDVVWTTASGRDKRIGSMGITHLANCVNLMKRSIDNLREVVPDFDPKDENAVANIYPCYAPMVREIARRLASPDPLALHIKEDTEGEDDDFDW